MTFDFTTIPSSTDLAAAALPGGPASELFSDPTNLAFIGNLCDGIKALSAGAPWAASPATVARLKAHSTAAVGIASGAGQLIAWNQDELVGTDVTLVSNVITVATHGLYAVTVKAIVNAGSGKLIDDAKLALVFNSDDDTIELGAAHPTAADTWEAAPSFTYHLPAAATIAATVTVTTHDASVWSSPATCVAHVQRVG